MSHLSECAENFRFAIFTGYYGSLAARCGGFGSPETSPCAHKRAFDVGDVIISRLHRASR